MSGRKRLALLAGVLGVALGGGTWFVLANRTRDEKLSIVVDESLAPALGTVDGLNPGDPPREVGRIVDDSGDSSQIVLGELVVGATGRNTIDSFLKRTGGRVVDEFAPEEPGGPGEFLVRVAPPAANVTRTALDLERGEPELGGRLRLSGAKTLDLLALAARESLAGRGVAGVEVGLNWLIESDGIDDGISIEVSPTGDDPNAFGWSFLKSGGVQDTGVTAAWSLLSSKAKLSNVVKVMVVDGGFVPNADFPLRQKVLQAKWGDKARLPCGAAPCPWHGTQVVLAAMGRLDNHYGTAGPAAPVAELVAVGAYKDHWNTLRRIAEIVNVEHPAVVNLSFGFAVTLFKRTAERAADRHFKALTKGGALLVASAGNHGRDVDAQTCFGSRCKENALRLPCESEFVMCVGGMGQDAKFKAPGSNYGSVGGRRSVEIYAPFATVGLAAPNDPAASNETTFVTGTSYSAPFVAGVAALVAAADPKLSPEKIRTILIESAHVGGVAHTRVISEGGRRVHALRAVAKVLNIVVRPPEVFIDSPVSETKLTIGDPVEFKGRATDFAGRTVPISWRSNINGLLNPLPTSSPVSRPSLSRGRHTITATATDVAALVGKAEITLDVVDSPPAMKILSPGKDLTTYPSSTIPLIGWTRDPETGQYASDDHLTWDVRIAGQVVFHASGHLAEIPANRLEPGTYQVRFNATYGGGKSGTERHFTVLPIPPGKTPPTAAVVGPADGTTFYEVKGNAPTITLKGVGSDKEDGTISGVRYRWTAVSEQSTRKTLCVGSGFPVSGAGGPPPATSCAERSVALGLDPKSTGPTTWAITLEVADSSGLIAFDTISITVGSG